MRKQITLGLLCALTVACSEASTDDVTQRGALMFDLTQDDVQALHDRYVPEEDITLTTARLTAPFDCALYDDLCAQVGLTQAIDYTEQLVELALEGATDEEIEAFSEEFLREGMELREEIEAAGEDGFSLRSGSTAWATHVIGNVRLRTRNGITTPVIGDREAWTEAKTQRRNLLGIWINRPASFLAVDVGVNFQTETTCDDGSSCDTVEIESFDPGAVGVLNQATFSRRTLHERNTGSWGWGGFSSFYTLYAGGSATATIDGVFLTASATWHKRIY